MLTSTWIYYYIYVFILHNDTHAIGLQLVPANLNFKGVYLCARQLLDLQ
jgi:type III secretory pathway component EscR